MLLLSTSFLYRPANNSSCWSFNFAAFRLAFDCCKSGALELVFAFAICNNLEPLLVLILLCGLSITAKIFPTATSSPSLKLILVMYPSVCAIKLYSSSAFKVPDAKTISVMFLRSTLLSSVFLPQEKSSASDAKISVLFTIVFIIEWCC